MKEKSIYFDGTSTPELNLTVRGANRIENSYSRIAQSDSNTTTRTIVCIPAFNEEKNIAHIVKEAKRFAIEVLVYDDGSRDNTYAYAREAGATVIHSPKNRGYGAAIHALFCEAKTRDANIMITIDADGQHDVTQIPELVDPLLKGEADIVIGSRFLKQNHSSKVPQYRKLGIKVITAVTNRASYGNISDAQSGFRAYSRKALLTLDLMQEGMAISTEILLKAHEHGLAVKEVPISVSYDVDNPSTHNPIKHGMDVLSTVIQMLSFKRPLIFYGLPGLVLLILAAYFATATLELFSQTRYISTNMIIVSTGLALTGIILIVTGCIVYTLIALFKGRIKNI